MKKNTQRNSLIITIPLVAVAAAWVFLVFLPIQNAIGRLQDEAEQKQQYCDRSKSLLPVLERSGRDLVNVRRQISYWDEAAPSHKDLASLLGEITAKAREAGLRITRFDPAPITMYERVSELPLSMGVTGTFSQLFTFIHDLEVMDPTIWVNSLEFEKSGRPAEIVACDLDLGIFMDNPEKSDQQNPTDNR